MPSLRLSVAAAGVALLAVGLVPAAAAAVAPAADPAPAVTVTPSTGLDRSGQNVSVTVTGVPEGKGVYLQWCPDNPAGTRWPSGTCASAPQVWASSSAAALAQGATSLSAQPFTLALTPTITTASGTVDCRTSACAVFVRLDHFSPGDTSLDRFAPVAFAAEPAPTPTPSPTSASPTPEAPAYTVTATPTSGLEPAGGTVAVTITGLADDQGVYVRLCALGSGGRPAADACDGQGRWVRETYPYGPYPTDGSVVKPSAGPVSLPVRAAFGAVDCTAVACGVHVRRDHLAPSDTSLDRAIPLSFAVAGTPSPTPTTGPTSSPSPTPTSTGRPEPSATPTSTGSPRVTLDRATVVPGGAVELTATGFAAGERVVAELHSEPVELGSATADADGEVALSVTVPAATAVGDHTVVLTGQSSGRTAETPLVVVAAGTAGPGTGTGDSAGDDDLASTGASAGGLGLLAAGLLAAGVALVVTTARRRTA